VYDLRAVLGETAGDAGIPHGRLLVVFAEAVLGSDDDLLTWARMQLADALGPDALVDAAAVVPTSTQSTGSPMRPASRSTRSGLS
jgi:hypothetical protein